VFVFAFELRIVSPPYIGGVLPSHLVVMKVTTLFSFLPYYWLTHARTPDLLLLYSNAASSLYDKNGIQETREGW
jgi:hypothetical protein